jgi:hypothetical protein
VISLQNDGSKDQILGEYNPISGFWGLLLILIQVFLSVKWSTSSSTRRWSSLKAYCCNLRCAMISSILSRRHTDCYRCSFSALAVNVYAWFNSRSFPWYRVSLTIWRTVRIQRLTVMHRPSRNRPRSRLATGHLVCSICGFELKQY